MYNTLTCTDIHEHNTCTHVHTHVHIHIIAGTHVIACACEYVQTHACRGIHIQTYTLICTHIHMNTYLLACTHTHMRICTHIHMYMHTHTNTAKAAVLEWNLEPAVQEDYSDAIF